MVVAVVVVSKEHSEQVDQEFVPRSFLSTISLLLAVVLVLVLVKAATHGSRISESGGRRESAHCRRIAISRQDI